MSREPVIFHDIYITPTADKFRDIILRHLAIHHPHMADFPEDRIHPLFPKEFVQHGDGDWDNDRVHKSLCILMADDDVPTLWTWEAANSFLRPIIAFEEIDPEEDSSEAEYIYRSFIQNGWMGHDHGRHFPNEPDRNFIPEEIELIPGPLLFHPDAAAIKAQYKNFQKLT